MADKHKDILDLFLESGLEKKRAEESVKNASIRDSLSAILKEAQNVEGSNVKDVINSLYLVSTTFAPEAVAKHRSFIVNYIMTKKIHRINFDAAKAFFKRTGADDFDASTFDKECGVGVVITRDQVKSAVEEFINEKKPELVEQRYRFPIQSILGNVRDKLKWADSKDIKEEVDAQVLALLGPKTEADSAPVKKEAKKKPEETKKVDAAAAPVEPVKELVVNFPDPKENKQLRPDILNKHLEETGGRVFCRFPPEPNGYLHLGHAKSMNLNFSYPKKSGGITYLRFDDTNPEAEKDEYFTSIIEDVEWMGHKPASITYSSDYFPQLYDHAIRLIKAGKAYVDHQTGDEIAEYREKRMESPWRNRSVEENLKLFDDMRKGKFKEGEATLRMKMDMKNDNPCMRDLIAYRIKFTSHPHVGDKWCIYPSYDYTHCLVDSLENITHSLCTLEFEVRRESYFWELDALEVYKPVVWEYSRLNVTHTVLSKRKLIKLVKEKIVRGWDDPRMPTIRGLRRRGYTADSINNFCDRIGVTRNENMISINLLEQCCRDDLEVKANRALVVLEPIKVTIVNWEGSDAKILTIPNHPKDSSRGTHEVPISSVIYIDKSDFREQDVKGYKRLAPNKEVGLLHVGATIKCIDFIKSTNGEITELKATIDWKPAAKPKGYIHWVAAPANGKEPLTIEVRLYDKLFKSEDPSSVEDWLSDINPNSLIIHKKCYADPSVNGLAVGHHLQFERTGYFVVDPETTPEKMVWNRVVGLKEAKWEE